MYSWEIQKYLEERNYLVDSDEIYTKIINTSSQITHVKSGTQMGDYFSYDIYTNDEYHWIVWMRCKV